MISNQPLHNRREQLYLVNNDVISYPVNYITNQSQIMIPDPLNNPTNPIQVINSNMPLNADNQSNLNIDAKSEIIHCDKAPNLVIKSFETNNKTMENQEKVSIQTKNNIAEQVPSLRNNSNSQIPHSTEEKALIKENNSTLPQDEEVTKENNNRVTFDTSKWGSNFFHHQKRLYPFLIEKVSLLACCLKLNLKNIN